jgi:integrase
VSDTRPKEPFVPAGFQVRSIKEGRTRSRSGEQRPYFDVVIRADQHRYLKRVSGRGMTKTAVTQNYVNRLRQDYLKGWAFDPISKTFVDPARRSEQPDVGRPTVFAEALGYMYRRWHELEPRSRQSIERALRRACLHLVLRGADGMPLEPPPAAVTWLSSAFSPPMDPSTFPAVRSASWNAEHPCEAWFLDNSMPFEDVTAQDISALLDSYRTNQHGAHGREVSPATERRFMAELRPMWRDVVDRLELERNPWDRELLRKRGAAGRGRNRISRVAQVDKDIVLNQDQVRTFAMCCAHYGRWDRRVICYTLLMGWAGLRPGEAAAVRISNLDLPSDGRWGWVTVDRTRRMGVTARWLDADEDPDEGPLKARSAGDARRAPLAPELVSLLRAHVSLFRHPATDLLFVDTEGTAWDPDAHWEQVWIPTRAAMFPVSDKSVRGRKLAQLRRHDLRHAACSAWLNAGVSPKVAQQWSGHSQLSVFLDVYQGVVEGETEASIRRLAEYLA